MRSRLPSRAVHFYEELDGKTLVHHTKKFKGEKRLTTIRPRSSMGSGHTIQYTTPGLFTRRRFFGLSYGSYQFSTYDTKSTWYCFKWTERRRARWTGLNGSTPTIKSGKLLFLLLSVYSSIFHYFCLNRLNLHNMITLLLRLNRGTCRAFC